MWKTKIFKVAIFLPIFVLMIGLVVSGWLHSISFAEEATSTLPDPAATSTAETTTGAASTSVDNSTSTQAVFSSSSTPLETPSLTGQAEELAPQSEIGPEEESVDEPELQPELQPESTPPTLPTPSLKERQLTKEIHIDIGARHSCAAKNFNVNLSGKNQAVVELKFTGMRSDSENLEIGSLPLGIDVTFLNNGDYSWSPSKSDSSAILQIVNQPGSQKGNFSIPIIYTSGNSTTICQINIINF